MKVEKISCPVCCEQITPNDVREENYICPCCGWKHDCAGENDIFHAYKLNELSLEQYRLRYEYYVSENPQYRWLDDGYPSIPQVEACPCPVCHKFQFEPLTWEDIYCGVKPADVYCPQCGWHYDEAWKTSPDLPSKANKMSFKEHQVWYESQLAANPSYRFIDELSDAYIPTPHRCPVCGEYEFSDEGCFEICPVCGWEDDYAQLVDPNFEGGANELSLNQYRLQHKMPK